MIHHVFATKSNVGDWLSAIAIQTLLAPVEVSEYFCDEPFVEKTLQRLRETPPNELIVIGGGGLFMDYFRPFWEGFREIAARKPFCIWGVGHCELKDAESRLPTTLLNEIASASRACFVRDESTRSYVNAALPVAVPCPTTAIVDRANGGGHGVLYADHYNVVGPQGYERISSIARQFAASTGREYRETDNQIPDGDRDALMATLELYRKSDVVVSSRLHGCIIALAMGRKTIAVSGDRKVESFMESAGLRGWVCDVNELSNLPKRLNELAEQETPWSFLQQVRKQNKAIARAVNKVIVDVKAKE